MSIDRYFDKFPVIQYGNSTSNSAAVDITERVVMIDVVRNNPFLFYPYDLSDYERPDQLSYRYYSDPYKSWMLYLSNKIIDPYYEWYLQEDELKAFVEKKYGSVETAIQKVKHYVNNWEEKDNISVSRYDSLTAGQQDYWQPVFSIGGQISSYSRKQVDWTVTTNQVVSYNVEKTSFIQDEIVNIVYDTNQGKGQVVASSNGVLVVQHTSGLTYKSSGSLYIYGTESETNTMFSNATIVVTNIPEDEQEYWKAVSYYDYESGKNEFNKTIQILDKKHTTTIVNSLKTLLRK